MAPADEQTKRRADEAVERIRALNEQMLEAGREWGQGYLDAYEQWMQNFADLQERTAEGADVQWLTQIAKAQADYTRQVTKFSTDAARRFLQ
jgi:hypothetical protein